METPAPQSSNRQLILRAPILPQPAEPRGAFSDHRDNLITFKHPGYPDQFGQNVLLTLFAFDCSGGGLQYATAHCACALIACNAWNGYFTVVRDGPRVTIDHDELLTERAYYFHVPSESTKYPIYPSFEEWAFPHDSLPPYWPSPVLFEEEEAEGGAAPSLSSLTAAVLKRDKACIITGQRDYLEKAHLCPRSSAEWFKRNGLSQFNLNRQLIRDTVFDDISNVLALRSDMHAAFDGMKFVIMPKQSRWVVHFMDRTNDLGDLYHNVPVEIHRDISSRCLLVRFAWAIFPSVARFLEAGPSRVVRVRAIEDDEYREVTRKMGIDELRLNIITTGKRSTSPNKRKGEEIVEESFEEKGHAAKRIRTPPTREPPELGLSTSVTADSSFVPSKYGLLAPTAHISNSDATLSCSASPPGESWTPWSLDGMKHEWRRRQRPCDSSLLCCDYHQAEAKVKAGILGPRKWSGGHLCDSCLGIDDFHAPEV